MTGKIVNVLYQTEYGPDEYTMEQVELLSKAADGVPAMFFVCRHKSPTTSITEVYLGANEEDWGDFESIGQLRRRDRDHKLSTYTVKAQNAFRMLRDTEQAQVAKVDPGLPPTKRKEISRKEAILSTRLHPDFLVRTTELGQAFTKALQLQQCCFACKGMMGYQVAETTKWKEKQITKYLCHFDWVKRGDYAHSCAEIAVSQLCSGNHLSEGRMFNY